MGKDEHERRQRDRSSTKVLGPQTREVLRPRRNGHKNVIEKIANPVANQTGQSDTSLTATSRDTETQDRRKKMGSDTGAMTAADDKRQRNIKYTYRDKDGNTTVGNEPVKFGPDTRSVIFTMADGSKSLEFALAELFPDNKVPEDLPEMVICAALFGLKTTVGNAVTSVKTGDTSEMYEALEERKRVICEGEWREGGQRGPSFKLVLEAVIAVDTQKRGTAPDEQRVAALKARIKEHGTKVILTNPEVAAEFHAAKMREMQRQLEAAREKAQQSQGNDIGLWD